MKWLAKVAGVALVVAGFGGTAWAESPKGKRGPAEQIKDIKIENAEEVTAEYMRPDEGVAEALVRKKQSSLIQVRTNFVDEILRSAEDL